MKTILIIILLGVLSGLYLAKPADLPITNNLQPTTNNQRQIEKVPEISVSITPEKIIQGDPVLVTINGTSSVSSIKFEGKSLGVFDNDGKPSALIGIDLRKTIGTYPLVITLSDGSTIKKNIVVGEKNIVKETFTIPEKLGGNTEESQNNLVSTLVQEGEIINSIPTTNQKLWDGTFRYPLEGPITITDVYGYSRLTGASTIAHKGTDFRAAVGTPVYAMNSGVVRFTDYLRNYGNTVIIDHGFGLQTIYMHLSEILVKNGDSVKKGQLIAKSGETGYVLGPHLHLSVKIDHVSIDPMKFMELLGSI